MRADRQVDLAPRLQDLGRDLHARRAAADDEDRALGQLLWEVVVSITDVRHREAVYRTMGECLKGVHPVSTGLVVQALARPEWLVEIDVAPTCDLDLPADLQFEPLVRFPPVALMGARHPLAAENSVTVEQLRDHKMVLLDLPVSADYFLSLFDKAGGKPVIPERTRDMAVMRSMVANHFGFSIANVRPLSATAPDGNPVHCVPIRGDVRALRMGFLVAQDATRSNAVRALVETGAEMVRTGQLGPIGGEELV